MAAAIDGDESAVAQLQSEAKQLNPDQAITQVTGVASAAPTQIQTGSQTQSAAVNSSPQPSAEYFDASITISAEMLSAIQEGNLGAIGALGTMASSAVVPPEKMLGIDIQTEDIADEMQAAIDMIRQLRAKQVQTPSPSTGEQANTLATGAIAKGIVEWIAKAIQTDKKKESQKGGKSQEDIDAAIRKVKAHLTDGIDGLDEIGEIAGVLCDIPMTELGPLLDSIKEAVNEFLDQQMGQLSGNDTRQLMTAINEIVGGMTGGATVFTEDQINQKVAEMGSAAPDSNASYAGALSAGPGLEEMSDLGDADAPPPPPSMGAMSFSKPKSVDLNTLQFNTSVSASRTSRVSAAFSASGDTSSDRNGAQRKVGEIVNFLEKLCETGLDQVAHQLTKQLDKMGLGKLIKESGLNDALSGA